MTIKPSFACLASMALASLLSLSTPSCAQSAQDEATTKEPATVLLVAGQSNADLPNSIKENGYRHCRWSYGSGDISGGGRFEPFWPRIPKKGNSEKWGFDAVVYHCLDQKAKISADIWLVSIILFSNCEGNKFPSQKIH